MLPTKSYKLEIFACMVASSSEKAIYETHRWQADINGLLDHVSKNALHLHEDTLERLRSDTENPQVLAMSTCSSEFTNARTIILAAMIPYSPGM